MGGKPPAQPSSVFHPLARNLIYLSKGLRKNMFFLVVFFSPWLRFVVWHHRHRKMHLEHLSMLKSLPAPSLSLNLSLAVSQSLSPSPALPLTVCSVKTKDLNSVYRLSIPIWISEDCLILATASLRLRPSSGNIPAQSHNRFYNMLLESVRQNDGIAINSFIYPRFIWGWSIPLCHH